MFWFLIRDVADDACRFIVNYTSEIHREGDLVIKRVLRCHEFGVVEREAHWLRLLDREPRTPRLLGCQDDVLKMNYAGEPLCRANAPHDVERQMEDILAMLKRHRCRHHDINPGNILVRNGWLSLIDFQWALLDCESVPAEWPEVLNMHFRPPGGGHDDAFSMWMVLESLGG